MLTTKPWYNFLSKFLPGRYLLPTNMMQISLGLGLGLKPLSVLQTRPMLSLSNLNLRAHSMISSCTSSKSFPNTFCQYATLSEYERDWTFIEDFDSDRGMPGAGSFLRLRGKLL